METFLKHAAAVTWVIVCVILLTACFVVAMESGRRFLQHFDDAAERKARQRLLERLMANSYWFSEHPPTSQLLHDIAVGLVAADYGVSDLRDAWRVELQKHEAARPSTYKVSTDG